MATRRAHQLYHTGRSFADESGRRPYTIPAGEWPYYPLNCAVLCAKQGVDVDIHAPSGDVVQVRDGRILSARFRAPAKWCDGGGFASW
jgi:hypothetical protein